MKYIVTKTTQKEWSVLVDAETEAEAFLALAGEYSDVQYPETKTTEISKVTVIPVPEKAPVAAEEAAPVPA